MFGWFRKRQRPEISNETPQQHDEAPQLALPTPAGHPAETAAPTESPEAASSQPAAPSPRPAMPLGTHPGFAGLGLVDDPFGPPRLLDPEAALSDEARDELTALLMDMFGPRGRYRLEWRPDRVAGDDAMFSQIMVADLVRRIQNAIARAGELEVEPVPLRAALEAAERYQHSTSEQQREPAAITAAAAAAELQATLAAFTPEPDELGRLTAIVEPSTAAHEPPAEQERRIA